MKYVILLFGAALATMTLIACDKEETKVADGPTKSVEINIANILTRSTGTAIADGTRVTLNDCQIFFTDGTTLYKGKNGDGTDAVHFFSGRDIPTTAVRYHFLPAAVNKVVVVGNLDEEKAPANLAAIEMEHMIADEQNADDLCLYGDSPLTLAATSPDEHAPLYTATVNLRPRVARLEVSGFERIPDESADIQYRYDKIVLNKIALNNWYNKAMFVSETASDLMNETIETGTVFGWINSLTNVWYADEVGLTLSVPNGADNTKTFVYHTFPAMVPQIVITCMNDDAPAYLATRKLTKPDGTEITAFEPGKIYKLAFKFKDSDFNQPDKCIDVTVTVASWEVVPVVPVF